MKHNRFFHGRLAAGALAAVAATAILAENAAKPLEAAAPPLEVAEAPAMLFPLFYQDRSTAVVSAAETADNWLPTDRDVDYIAKTIYGEAATVPSKARQAAVAWCILNRVDSSEFPDTIEEVVVAPHQFAGYRSDAQPPEEYRQLARDVLLRWHREQQGQTDVGRTLPKGWCFFTGNGKENRFTAQWRGKAIWDWALPDPYQEER